MTIISFQDANYPKPKPCIAKDNGVVGDDHGDDDGDDGDDDDDGVVDDDDGGR